MVKISPSKAPDEIDPSKARRTYLITYSQADIDAQHVNLLEKL